MRAYHPVQAPGTDQLRRTADRTAAPASRLHAAIYRFAVHDVLSSPGQPLGASLKEEMEVRLGADFSDVRVHTDSAARASVTEVGARAYSSGPHVVIGPSAADKHTLAHELTHVIQQRQGPVSGTDHGNGFKVSDPFDVYERAAEANAARVMRAPLTQHRLGTAGTGEQWTSAVHPGGGSEQTHQRAVNDAEVTSDTCGHCQSGLVHIVQQSGVRHGDARADAREVELAATAPSAAGVVAARTGWPSVQRVIENATYNTDDVDAKKAADEFFEAVDNATQAAYRYVVSVPSLGGLAGLDGRTKHWRVLWDEFVTGGKPKLMAAAFGYVVESLVSNPDSTFAVKIPEGYSVISQFVSGGTRPDLLLRLEKGTAHIAWLDLTAAGSVGHIYDKEDWAKKVPIFAEVTYPSLNPATLALMWQNKHETGTVNEEEFKKRQEAARLAHAQRQKEWKEIGKKLQGDMQSKVEEKTGLLKNLWGLDENPEKVRNAIAEILEEAFQATEAPSMKMVPSILCALGLDSGRWGFTTGFSESRAAGEAWLIDNPYPQPSAAQGE